MIKLILLDIDGVITDGTITVNASGDEQKKINLKDIDAIFELKRQNYKIGAITGENTKIVDYFENRFAFDYFYKGNKDKLNTIKQIEKLEGITRDEICYVGDGKYDLESLVYVGLGICPKDAIPKVKNAVDIILQNNAGAGCLWELIDIINNYNDENTFYNFLSTKILAHNKIFKTILSDKELVENISFVADEVIKLLKNNNQLFLCGNGGSAADAQHIAAEFVGRFYKERKALNAEALTTNVSTLTALGNDYGFERVFSRQLEAKARRGDLIIGISTSGKAKNVLEALEYAKSEGITTILLTGCGNTKDIDSYNFIDRVLKIPSRDTPRIQEAHIFIGHTLAEFVEEKLYKIAID